jgi:DNA-binding MarR family transcriptional regulator
LIVQQLRTQATPAAHGWSRLIRAYAAITRELNARLSTEHGLTINEYEVLLRLARAEDCRMRRVDLATELVLSPSGITRLLDRLGAEGLVEKAECASDARVTYAVLTEEGMSKLKAAGRSHRAAIEELLGTHLGTAQLRTLSEILERLPGVDRGGECTVDAGSPSSGAD